MTRPNRDFIRVNLYLPRKLKNAAAAIAKRQDKSYSEFMREALRAHVKSELAKLKR